MKRELKLKKNHRIKESFYMLTARAKDHKKATEEEEEVKVVVITEEEEDAITVAILDTRKRCISRCMLSLRQDRSLCLRLSRPVG